MSEKTVIAVVFLVGLAFMGVAVYRWRTTQRLLCAPCYVGARFQRDATDGGGWRPLSEAPRDGTVVEIKNNAGVAPYYELCQWGDIDGSSPAWRSVNSTPGRTTLYQDVQRFMWRPYRGDVSAYVDPTKGAQHESSYWRGAVAAEQGLRPDAFEALVRANKREREQFGDGNHATYYPHRLLSGSFTLHRGVWVDDAVERPSNTVLDEFRERMKNQEAGSR